MPTKLKPVFSLLLLCFVIVAAPAATFSTYKGAWFEIRYPSNFTVKPQQESSSGEGYDAVSFVSPDDLVEFYVFSPQWSGEPQWIKRREGEKQTSWKQERQGDKVITYVTRQGNGYLRSYADIKDTVSNTRWTFGFRYRDQAIYKQYRPVYVVFRQSLKQFAD